jgi:methionyl-tRNA formyltransferase
LEVKQTPLRLGFAGTPIFAANILNGILGAGYQPKIVLTQPDRAKGRGKKLAYSAVKQLALEFELNVAQPYRLKGAEEDSACNLLEPLNLDILVVAAYGLILPKRILDLPKYGCLNVHASILPRWRGAAPIERSIMHGDTESGVSIMSMDEGMDTGPVYTTSNIELDVRETGDSLHHKLAEVGTSATLQCLERIKTISPTPQDHSLATYAAKLTPEDSLIDWHQPALDLERKVRALYSRQPAYSFIGAERIRILSASMASPGHSRQERGGVLPGTILDANKSGCEVATGDGVLKILSLQIARGKGKAMPFSAALNGYPDLFVGRRFQNGG